jgi:hypothetical protein
MKDTETAEIVVVLSRCELVPAADEADRNDPEIDTPSFEVAGTADGRPFEGRIEIEIDGRDLAWRGVGLEDGPAEDASALAAAVQAHGAWAEAIRRWDPSGEYEG